MAIIYTDGSCMPNPGVGGWACVIIDNDEEWRISGGDVHSTNNRMELTAVIESLKFCNNSICTLYTDSLYVMNCAIGKWSRKKNKDLWDIYSMVSTGKTISWNWVKGHSGDKYNEIVDQLSKKEAIEIKKK